jgi:hypothetical protein
MRPIPCNHRFFLGVLAGAFLSACGADAPAAFDPMTRAAAGDRAGAKDGEEADDTDKAPPNPALYDFANQTSTLSLGLQVNLTTLFSPAVRDDQYRNHMRPGYKPHEETGSLVLNVNGANTTFAVGATLHGNSSLEDCEFPKLNVKFKDPAQTKGTIFEGHKSLVLRTHCGTNNKNYGNWFRTHGEMGVRREMFAYRALQILGVDSFRFRLGRIRYADVGGGNSGDFDVGLLEPKKETGKRLGGKWKNVAIREAWSTAPARDVGMDNLAQVALAELLTDNVDWFLDLFGPNDGRVNPYDPAYADDNQPNQHFLWNIGLVTNRAQPARPMMLIPYDFDIAGMAISFDKNLDLVKKISGYFSLYANNEGINALQRNVWAFLDKMPQVRAELKTFPFHPQDTCIRSSCTVNGVVLPSGWDGKWLDKFESQAKRLAPTRPAK